MKDITNFSVEKFNKRYYKEDVVLENEIKVEMCKHCLSDTIKQYSASDVEEAVCNLLMSDIDKYYSDVNINSIQAIETYGEIQFITEFDGKDNGKLNKDIINYPDGVIRFTVDENDKIIRK